MLTIPSPLLVAGAALAGAALGWWPLWAWIHRSLIQAQVQRPVRVLVSAATAIAFGLLVWRLGDGNHAAALPAALVFAIAAVVLAAVDVAELRLPNAVILPLLGALAAALVVASAVEGRWWRLLWALGGAAAMFGIYLVLALISPKSMGMGDVKLAAPLGLLLGWFGLKVWFSGLVAAFICGAVVAVVMLALRKTTMRGSFPFGPSMLVGTLVALLIVA